MDNICWTDFIIILLMLQVMFLSNITSHAWVLHGPGGCAVVSLNITMMVAPTPAAAIAALIIIAAVACNVVCGTQHHSHETHPPLFLLLLLIYNKQSGVARFHVSMPG